MTNNIAYFKGGAMYLENLENFSINKCSFENNLVNFDT